MNEMNTTPPAVEVVYDFDATQRGALEVRSAQLLAEGFHPETEVGWRGGKHMSGITLPADEALQLRKLQYTDPRTWGNHPAVLKQFEETRMEIEANAERRDARLKALTPEQREFIEVLHYESKDMLKVDEALDLNEKLHELCARHQRLAHIHVLHRDLTAVQLLAREHIEKEVMKALEGLPGTAGPLFVQGPRGATAGICFESGRKNSAFGCYMVPINPVRMGELQHEDFANSTLPAPIASQGAEPPTKASSQQPTIRRDVVHADAPGELGAAWEGMCQAENRLADYLSSMSIGTAVVQGCDAWYLQEEEQQMVLMHAELSEGLLVEAQSRFEFDLDWVDLDVEDLIQYTRLVDSVAADFQIDPARLKTLDVILDGQGQRQSPSM